MGPAGPPLAWKSSGVGSGFAGVAVAGERLYTMGDKDGAQHVFALKREGGAVLWKARVGPPLVDSRGGARATPVVDGERVYAIGTSGDLVCLEAATGSVVWSKNLERDYGGRMMSSWMWSESPLVDGDRLVFTPGARDAALVAVDKATGRDVWRAAIPDLGPEGPRRGRLLLDRDLERGRGEAVRPAPRPRPRRRPRLRREVPLGLQPAWRTAWRTSRPPSSAPTGSSPRPATRPARCCSSSSRSGDGVAARELYFLDAKTLQNHHGGLVLVGNHVYAGHGHNKGFPICVDFITGKVAWGGDIRNAGTGSAAVMYADGRLYFRYENGVVRPDRGEPGRLRREGLVHDPGRPGPELGPPLDRRRPALRARAGQPLLLRHPAGEVRRVGEGLIPR